MTHSVGILFALISLLCWGFGDFFIQKATRVIGSVKALFFIGVVGFVGLFPFAIQDLSLLGLSDILLLSLLVLVVVFASLFDFEALRQGKIAVIEPIIGLELPLTVGLSIVLANEKVSPLQFVLIGMVFIGIILAITTRRIHLRYHERLFERGVMLAGVGAIGMAVTNLLVGLSSQNTSALITIWFAHSCLALICGVYLIWKGEWRSLFSDIQKHPKIIIGQSVLDTVAWIAYATATTIIPIAITTTIVESYVALAALLGVVVNREKLKPHQITGVLFAIAGVIILSYISAV